MNWELFALGMLGALLTVYLAKQEVIPEFRPLFDIYAMEKEFREHQDHIKKTEKNIDDIQAKLEALEAESLSEDAIERLATVLETSQEELREERIRLQELEREIKQNQIISRSLGFLFYIVLGGVFGSLLAGRVQIEGLSGDLPDFFESIVIGATWTSYLSVIGFSQVGKKVDEKLEVAKKEIIETVAREAEKTGKSLSADKVTEIANANFDLTRKVVQREVKGGL